MDVYAFDQPRAEATSVVKLQAASAAELSVSLKILAPGGQGWISFEDAVRLFSMHAEEPSEWDADRVRILGNFAAERRCEPRTEPSERRVYFAKKP